VLSSNTKALSRQQRREELSRIVTYYEDDLTVITWNAAIIFGTNMEDVLTVLELANVQLLELRFLDGRLDRTLDRSYEILGQRRSWRMRIPGASRADLVHVGQMQVDAAILFERVSNALKLLGDQHLARVYRLASQRLRLDEWAAVILRKLEVADSIYTKLDDRASSERMELLEWIIVVLIALELVLPLLGWGRP
jgi:hypothetical protein